jgi:PAS domain S-box-containing protein
MDGEGTIKEVSKSFTNTFGYSNNDLEGRNFSILFTDVDNEIGKAGLELKKVLATAQASDDSYVVHKNGTAVWCTGESLLVSGQGKDAIIVKDVVSLQPKMDLQILLTEKGELLEAFFETSSHIPVMVLDGTLKIKKINTAFLKLFEIENTFVAGASLGVLHHSFWSEPDIKDELRKSLVNREPLRNKRFVFSRHSGGEKVFFINTSITEVDGVITIYLMIMTHSE